MCPGSRRLFKRREDGLAIEPSSQAVGAGANAQDLVQIVQFAMGAIKGPVGGCEFVARPHHTFLLMELPGAGGGRDEQRAQQAHPEARTIRRAPEHRHQQTARSTPTPERRAPWLSPISGWLHC